MVYRGCWWNVCFVIVWYWIIGMQICHALIMACYLVGHSNGVCNGCICYWQALSCLLFYCGLRITNTSFEETWDACLIWIRSLSKFTSECINKYMEWNLVVMVWIPTNMPCKLEFVSVPIDWLLQYWFWICRLWMSLKIQWLWWRIAYLWW